MQFPFDLGPNPLQINLCVALESDLLQGANSNFSRVQTPNQDTFLSFVGSGPLTAKGVNKGGTFGGVGTGKIAQA